MNRRLRIACRVRELLRQNRARDALAIVDRLSAHDLTIVARHLGDLVNHRLKRQREALRAIEAEACAEAIALAAAVCATEQAEHVSRRHERARRRMHRADGTIDLAAARAARAVCVEMTGDIGFARPDPARPDPKQLADYCEMIGSAVPYGGQRYGLAYAAHASPYRTDDLQPALLFRNQRLALSLLRRGKPLPASCQWPMEPALLPRDTRQDPDASLPWSSGFEDLLLEVTSALARSGPVASGLI